MARTPGPVWVEINSEIVRSPDFVCLADATKAAWVTWAILYPAGDLGPLPLLAAAVLKTPAKTLALLHALQKTGFVERSPNGKLTLTAGWVRPHKGSASRMSKMRAGAKGHCDVTMAANVTSHTPSHSGDCDVTMGVTSGVTVTSPKPQKEIPLRNPLRKTPNSEDEFGVHARSRATPTEPSPFVRVLWQEIGEVPEKWLHHAAAERLRIGLEPVDMALVAANFTDTYGPQLVNRKTRTEWQGQFNKFTRREFAGKPNGTASGKSRQIDELARIIEREQRAVSGGEILQDGDGFFDRANDLCLPGEAWREHGGTRQ